MLVATKQIYKLNEKRRRLLFVIMRDQPQFNTCNVLQLPCSLNVQRGRRRRCLAGLPDAAEVKCIAGSGPDAGLLDSLWV
jgi:hypothetical protein